MAAGASNGQAIMDFTLSGNGGPFAADNGGFYPSTAFGRLTARSSNAIFIGGKYYFADNYIQYPNCLPPKFTLTVGTCGGTRDGLANWGTSVNYVSP
jgi:hypothetical protein